MPTFAEIHGNSMAGAAEEAEALAAAAEAVKQPADEESPYEVAATTPVTTDAAVAADADADAGADESEGTAAAALTSSFMAIFSVCFLIAVASGKTILTKAVFANFSYDFPVVLSGLSCIFTCGAIALLWVTGMSQFAAPKSDKLMSMFFIAIFTALGMAFQNLALNLLSVAIQQVFRATLPVWIIVLEITILRLRHSPWIYGAVFPLVMGPIICVMSSTTEISTLGMVYMGLGVTFSALKVIYLVKLVREIEAELHMVAFLFWLDAMMLPILLPWALFNGELVGCTDFEYSWTVWGVLALVSLMGGLRAFSINLVVKYASALTKTCADVFSQALTIYFSMWLFSTKANVYMHTGVAVSIAGFMFYTYVQYQQKLAAKLAKAIQDEVAKVEGVKQPLLHPEEAASSDDEASPAQQADMLARNPRGQRFSSVV